MVVDLESTRDEVDAVFHALADATRRDILSRVPEREQSVSALAGSCPVSLQAVQKHVGVLERAGLVGKVRQGREQRFHADPQRPAAVGVLLDRFETVRRHRVAATDVLLAEGAEPASARE